MKNHMKLLVTALCVCMLSACANEASQQKVDGNTVTGAVQIAETTASMETEPGKETAAQKETEPVKETAAQKETEPTKETAAPQKPEPTEQTGKDGRCGSSANHFTSCKVTPGNGQLQIDFVNDVPMGEVDGFFFYLWDSANATADELDATFLDGNNSWYLSYEDTTYTFENLTNGQTYHIYALVYIDNWKYPNEADSHDAWYIGAFTPTAG